MYVPTRNFRWYVQVLTAGAFIVPGLAGCRRDETLATTAPPPASRPNILWITWDTVRADHTQLYGYDKPTTPNLAAWAQDARVFADCVSPGPTTTLTHGTWFTGLYPSEHGATDLLTREHNERSLDGKLTTLAELLRGAGYQTYVFSANPNISASFGFTRGFDVEEHPWDEKYVNRAMAIVQDKLQGDMSSELPITLQSNTKMREWAIKASGELHEKALTQWLAQRDRSRPYFAFLNYMEAHRPYIPARAARQRLMTPAQIEASYQVDRSWISTWAYTFGLKEYTPEEIELTRLTYDATLTELDEHFKKLMEALQAQGALDNTVVIVTSDHGELLGEHHMLDHQYAVHEELLRVPLIIHHPRLFPAGREERPVSTLDLFPTLLEVAGAARPANLPARGVSLLRPLAERDRFAEYPRAFETAFQTVGRAYPQLEPQKWRRSLRAFYRGCYKAIWASDGRHELFDLCTETGGAMPLTDQPHVLADMLKELDRFLTGLRAAAGGGGAPVDPGHLKHLKPIGYVGDDDAPAPSTQPTATQPGTP